MTEVMVEIPDSLLAEIDDAASRRGVSRDELLRRAACSEIGTSATGRDEIVDTLDGISSWWPASIDTAQLPDRGRRREGLL